MKKFEPRYRLVRYGLATKGEKASRQQRMSRRHHLAYDSRLTPPQANRGRTGQRSSVVPPRPRARRARRTNRHVDGIAGSRLVVLVSAPWRIQVCHDGRLYSQTLHRTGVDELHLNGKRTSHSDLKNVHLCPSRDVNDFLLLLLLLFLYLARPEPFWDPSRHPAQTAFTYYPCPYPQQRAPLTSVSQDPLYSLASRHIRVSQLCLGIAKLCRPTRHRTRRARRHRRQSAGTTSPRPRREISSLFSRERRVRARQEMPGHCGVSAGLSTGDGRRETEGRE